MDKRKRRKDVAVALTAMVVCLLFSRVAGAEESGSLVTAEFPDVVEFDFEQVNEQFEKVSENVGATVPLLDEALAEGQAALEAGETARAEPTDENKQRFVAAVLAFVRGAEEGKARIAEMAEQVRGIHTRTNILYAQATTQTEARVAELRKEFEREEVKFKEIVARNKARRREEELTEWELRKLFEEEKRQARALDRLADRIAFQQDFAAALQDAAEQSVTDFALYDQFFAETADALDDISALASNLPIVVERLRIQSALGQAIPGRKAAVAGFAKLEKTRTLTRKIAEQLVDLCADALGPAGTDAETEAVLQKRAESYKLWLQGESLDYRRPPKDKK